MNRLRSFILFVSLMLTVNLSFGQLVQDLHMLYQPSLFPQQEDTSMYKPWYRFTPGETKYSIEVGAGYSSFGNNAGFSNSYISPMVSYSASENLQIVVGGRFSNNNYQNMNMFNQNGGGFTPQSSGNPTEAFAYGRYIVNNKISVYGMGAIGKNQPYFSPYSTSFGTANYQQYAIGMDYRVNEKLSFGASFGFSNGPAWGNSPFYRNSSSPFFP